MARLVAFGVDNGNHALSELDTVDLEAIAAVRDWGVSNGHAERVPPSPCERSGCGGSVLIWDGERRCILCARPGGVDPLPATQVNGYGPRNASGTL